MTVDSADSSHTAQYAVGGSADYVNIDVGHGYNGQVDQSNYTLTSSSVFYLGVNDAAHGTYNLSGSGTLSTASEEIGQRGTAIFTQSGGTHTASGTIYLAQRGGNATYTLSGGALSAGREVIGDTGTGIFTQSSGTNTINDTLNFSSDGGSGIYSLKGGTLILDGIIVGSAGTSTFNFNGGTLQASSTSTMFMTGLTTAKVQSGGALIDTHGYDITVGQALVHDTALGSTADGGLNKSNTGTLTLAGTNTYSGTTVIGAGTLAVNNDGATATGRLVNTSSITINKGGKLALGGIASVTDRLNNTATITLAGGGTFATNGLSEGSAPSAPSTGGAVGVGALTLSSTSSASRATVDFAPTQNGSTLIFGSLASGKGAYVNILGWTGVMGGDNGAVTNDRILFVTDPGFTSADLANWQFSDDQGTNVGSGATEISFNGYFEVVPVPEPATWFAGTLLAGLAGKRWCRRRYLTAKCGSNRSTVG